MAIRVWTGKASPVSHVKKFTVSGQAFENSTLRSEINGKIYTYTIPSRESGFPKEVGGGLINDSSTLEHLANGIAGEIVTNANEFPEYDEISVTVNADFNGGFEITVTTPYGIPVDITIDSLYPGIDVDSVAGTPGVNEVQKYYFSKAPTSGTYEIDWDLGSGVENSDAISYAGSPQEIKAKMISGMASITEDNLTVTGSGTQGDPFILTLSVDLSSQDVAQLSIDDALLSTAAAATLTETVAIGEDTKEVQVIWIDEENRGVSPLRLEMSLDGGATFEDGTHSGWISTGLSTVSEIESELSSYFTSMVGSSVTAKLYRHGQGYESPGGSFEMAAVVLIYNDTNAHDLPTLRVAYFQEDLVTPYGNYRTPTVRRLTAGSAASQNHLSVYHYNRNDGGYSGFFDVVSPTAFTHEGNATTGDVTAAKVEALASIGAGNCKFHTSLDTLVSAASVTDDQRIVFVEFTGTLASAAQDVTEVDAQDGGWVDNTVTGLASGNETQELVINADGGTFTLSDSSGTTAALAHDISAASLETAIEGLSDIGAGNATVTGTGETSDPFRIAYGSGLAGDDVYNLVADDSLLTLSISTTESTITPGVDGIGEQWIVTLHGATGGEMSFSFRDDKTANLAYNATAATIQTAMEGLDSVGSGGMTVTGSGTLADPFVFQIQIDTSDDHPQLEAFTEDLTGTAYPTVTGILVREATGPCHWDADRNWLKVSDGSAGVPETGDDVILDYGSADRCPKYGLDQSAVSLNSLRVYNYFDNLSVIGLPRENVAGYLEYRDRFLQIGFQGDRKITIGGGEGGGSGMMNIDTGADEVHIKIFDTSSPEERYSVQWKGSNANSTIELIDGFFGASVFPGDDSQFASFTMREGEAYLGKGCIAGDVEKTGGNLETDEAAINGTLTILG